MPSLLLGLPNKREGEQENLHTFSDNTSKEDKPNESLSFVPSPKSSLLRKRINPPHIRVLRTRLPTAMLIFCCHKCHILLHFSSLFLTSLRTFSSSFLPFRHRPTNDTLFSIKRYVVFHQTTRRFSSNLTSFSLLLEPKSRISLKECYKDVANHCSIVFYNNLCDTCDSKNIKTPGMRARTRTRECTFKICLNPNRSLDSEPIWVYLLRVRRIIPNRSLDRYCAICYIVYNFLPSFIFLLASCCSFVLAVARYAFELTINHLLNNLMKSVQDLMPDLGLFSAERVVPSLKFERIWRRMQPKGVG